jgi:hypothetical protein
MTKKLTAVLCGMLFFFSCGDLPEIKPTDWNARLSFTEKPYTGDSFTNWENDVPSSTVAGAAGDVAQSLSKSQRWKGSGAFPANGAAPVYYVFHAAEKVAITIDWKYGQDNGIGFAYKRAGSTNGNNYGADQKQIPIGQDEYLVLRISPSASASGAKWELGFTVK